MGVEEIIDAQIDIQDGVIERASFGVGLIVGSSGKLTGAKVQEFADATAVAEVFSSGDPELTMANDFFGQTLKPTKVLIGDRSADVKQKNKILITSLQNDTDYTVNISVDGGASVEHTITSDSNATRAEIVDALIAAIQATDQNDLLTLTDNGDDFDIEAGVAGDPLTITVSSNMSSQLITANVNIATELADMQAVNDNWYALIIQAQTSKDIKRAAEFIQARRKIFFPHTDAADVIGSEQHQVTLDFDADFVTDNDIDLDIDGIPVAQTSFNSDQSTTMNDLASNIQAHPNVETATVTDTRQVTITSALSDTLLVFTNISVTGGASQANGEVTTVIDPTTDLGSELKALSYDRTALFFTKNAATEYPSAGWVGGRLPNDPGSQTWAFKTVSGITVDNLTASEKSKAHGNNVNTYTVIGDNNLTQNGTMASGRFIDIRRGVDKFLNDIEVELLSRFINNAKIPFTKDGLTIIQDGIEAAIQQSITSGTLAADPAPEVTLPALSSISANDKAARLLSNVKITATLAGGIHKVTIRGTVKV